MAEDVSEEVQDIYEQLDNAQDQQAQSQNTSDIEYSSSSSDLLGLSRAVYTNPLKPKTKENLSEGSFIKAKTGRVTPQMSPSTGPRYISIQAYSGNALNDTNTFTSLGYDVGLQIKVTKKPTNGSGWDEVIDVQDITAYDPAVWTSWQGVPNAGSLTTTSNSTHFHLNYDYLAFDANNSSYQYHTANGMFDVDLQVTFASGHVEVFTIPCPVGAYYWQILEYAPWQGSKTFDQEQEVRACENKAGTEWYSKGKNWLQGATDVGVDTTLFTRIAPDPSFNPSGTLADRGYVSRLTGWTDPFEFVNRIDFNYGDFLVDTYGQNGITTVDQFQTAKQVIKRIDVIAQDGGSLTGYTDYIDGKDWAWFQANYTANTNGPGYVDDVFTGPNDPTSYESTVNSIRNQNQFPQSFVSTFYYSENITSCATPPGATYNVCDTQGNPSYYATTGLDCSGTTIPSADLPGGSNFANVTYVHDATCCTTCTLTVSVTTVDATNGVSDGEIHWDATSGGVSSGNPFNTGSEYTVTITDASGTSVGYQPPTGGNTFTDATCDTTNGSTLVTCNSTINIKPGMQVSGTGIQSGSYVGPITTGTLGVNVQGFQLVDTLGNALPATATNTDETLTFATGHTAQHGGLAPNTPANPFYTVCVTDEDNCVECNSVVVSENPVITTYGCTDPSAINYDPNATISNNTCIACNSTTGLLEDPVNINVSPTWDTFSYSQTAATENSPCSTWNSDGVLNVSATPVFPLYLEWDVNSKFEILLYKVVNNGDTSLDPGAVQIGGTINAGTLNNVTVAAHQFTGLDYGYYSIRFRYVDSNTTSTMEDCWTEFNAIVKAQVCDDANNSSYCGTPSDPLLRQSAFNLCTPTPPACCNLNAIQEHLIDPTDPCSGTYLTASADCDPSRVVDIEWQYSPTGTNYTSLGTYSLGNVSGVSGNFYSYTNNDTTNGTNWVAVNGSGFYKVILTGTYTNITVHVCNVDITHSITLPTTGCMDPAAHNYDPTATCPGTCAYPSYDCDPNTGNCIDPWNGTLNGYTPGAYNCLNGPGCCNAYCSPPVVHGCTDSCAANYDPNATIDDGSCMYTACLAWPSTNQYQNCCNNNYYPPSQIIGPDNSCCIMPCAIPNTLSYTTTDSTSTCTTFNTDGSVSVSVVLNFSNTATWTFEIYQNNQTTLVYTDPVTYTGNTTSNVYSQLGSGNYWGVVTDSYGCHAGMAFTINSTSPKVGCTDPNANNYDPLAVCDCCCQIQGCLDPNASNFNPNANIPGQCDYILPPPSPCIPPSLDETKIKIKACLNKKGTDWLNDYKVGRADDCSLMDQWKLILVDYLVGQDISCLYNCQDLETPPPTIAQNCNDIWVQGGPSTGVNHQPAHAGASVINPGEGTTVTAYDNFPTGWFGVDALSNPSNNFTYVGDVIKFELPTGHPLATWLNGTIWTLTTPSSFPSGIHNGCSTQKIQHYTQCLDMNTISITTNINYYDNFINFVNKFCADCNISIIKNNKLQ